MQQKNYWDQYFCFKISKKDWSKSYIIEANLFRQRKKFLSFAKKLLGQGFFWELSINQNPDESIVLL